MTLIRSNAADRDRSHGDSTDPENIARIWRRRGPVVTTGMIALLLVIVLIWRSCYKTNGEAEAVVEVSVQVAKAERITIANDISTVATLSAAREATISARVAAPIAQMPLLVNRSVHAGEVIAVLESRDLAAQRAEAAAAVTESTAVAHETVNGSVPLTNAQDQKSVTDAQAVLGNARKTYERRQKLFADGGISKKELEASQLAVVNAEDDLRLSEEASRVHRSVLNPGDITVAAAKARQAQERLANLDAQLGYMTIRAPFDGVVTQQWQYQGELANPAGKLVTLADSSSLIAKMQVAGETATRLKSGDAVQVFPDDTPGRDIQGTIFLVGRGADAQNRTVEVWVRVPNPAGLLRPNGVARVVIAAQLQQNAVVVPSAAVTLDGTNGASGTVMVVDGKSIAHEVHVTTGVRSGDKIQITTGLTGGETVVIEGNYGLPDGTKVVLPVAEIQKGNPQPKGGE